jgi:hypothetical protein
MTIDSLIKWLENYKKAFGGDKEVLVSGDPEGNDYRTIDEVVAVHDKNLKEHIIIYPTDTLIPLE